MAEPNLINPIMTISNQKIMYNADNQYYLADYCEIHGNGIHVWGSNNQLFGNNMEVHGHYNVVQGDQCIVEGNNNTISGSKCIIRGNFAKAYGRFCEVFGEQCGLVGDDGLMEGALAHSVGQRNIVNKKRILKVMAPNDYTYGYDPSLVAKVFTEDVQDYEKEKERHRQQLSADMKQQDIKEKPKQENVQPPTATPAKAEKNEPIEISDDEKGTRKRKAEEPAAAAETKEPPKKKQKKTKKILFSKLRKIFDNEDEKVSEAPDVSVGPPLSPDSKKSKACVVCKVNEKRLLMQECKHFCLCFGCARQLIDKAKSEGKDHVLCPCCGTKIIKKMLPALMCS